MKRFTEKLLHYAVLVLPTAFSVWVMWLMSRRGDETRRKQGPFVRPLPLATAPKARVNVERVKSKPCEITVTFSGKIEPWETYTIGFEAPGRVIELGRNQQGKPLDDGDQVKAGQLLAQLDDRIFRAQRGEASARAEQASSDLRRDQRIRAANPTAITESQLQRRVTDQATAQAQLEVATKSLEDATLRAPVDATISKRMIKVGETVGAQQMAFELVQNQEVLLVLSVPETRIREIESRMREIYQTAPNSENGLSENVPEEQVFRAHVELEGRDNFGNPWPAIDGEVYRIAELADPRTSLFDVEVRLPNTEGLLRPGMVATAKLVVDRIQGYEVPSVAVIYRQDRAHLFTVERETAPMEMLYWSLGPVDLYRARRIELKDWVDQGRNVVVPANQVDLSSVIVRGQLRLANTQLVRVINEPALPGVEVAAWRQNLPADRNEAAEDLPITRERPLAQRPLAQRPLANAP